MKDEMTTKHGITYSKQGDHNLPNLTMPPLELNIGMYARKRKEFLEKHNKVKYYNLLTSVKLVEHLNEVDLRAREMEERLIKDFSKQ